VGEQAGNIDTAVKEGFSPADPKAHDRVESIEGTAALQQPDY